jgi:hypothetical protein
MNQPLQQNIHYQNLYHFAATSAQYLQATDRGAIRIHMRHSAIYALNGLSIALQHEQFKNGTLTTQLATANARIAQLELRLKTANKEIIRLAAESAKKNRTISTIKEEHQLEKDSIDQAAKDAENRLVEDESATEEFRLAEENMEKAREESEVNNLQVLAIAEQKFKKELKVALEAAKKEKVAKQNSNRILSQVLSFATRQPDALTGYMSRKYNIINFDPNSMTMLVDALNQDIDLEFGDDVMGLVGEFEDFDLQLRVAETSVSEPKVHEEED